MDNENVSSHTTTCEFETTHGLVLPGQFSTTFGPASSDFRVGPLNLCSLDLLSLLSLSLILFIILSLAVDCLCEFQIFRTYRSPHGVRRKRKESSVKEAETIGQYAVVAPTLSGPISCPRGLERTVHRFTLSSKRSSCGKTLSPRPLCDAGECCESRLSERLTGSCTEEGSSYPGPPPYNNKSS